MLIGYARVSPMEHHLDLQLDVLGQAGCTSIFTDNASGTKAERPELEQAVAHLRDSDTLVVWRLDRLGKSLNHLIETLTKLDERNIGFKSLSEDIDTTTPDGKLAFHIVIGSLAEFERDILRERTQAGLEAARARGRNGGRPKSLTGKKAAMAQALYKERGSSISEICKALSISRTTLYRYVKVKPKEVVESQPDES